MNLCNHHWFLNLFLNVCLEQHLEQSFPLFWDKIPQKWVTANAKENFLRIKVALARGNFQCIDTMRTKLHQKLECMFTARKKRYRDQCPVEESFHNLRKKNEMVKNTSTDDHPYLMSKISKVPACFPRFTYRCWQSNFFKIYLPHLSIAAHAFDIFDDLKLSFFRLQNLGWCTWKCPSKTRFNRKVNTIWRPFPKCDPILIYKRFSGCSGQKEKPL